jgi:hypothetical protein
MKCTKRNEHKVESAVQTKIGHVTFQKSHVASALFRLVTRDLQPEGRPLQHGVPSMNALRALRRSADLGQRELAALLSVSSKHSERGTADGGRRTIRPSE